MSLFIEGVGAVSPLGPDAATTWGQLVAGNQAPRKSLADKLSDRLYEYVPVPEKFVAEAARHSRLRRSGMLSLAGAAAAFNALADAGLQLDRESAKKWAIVYAISSGGVNHTRRFFHELVSEGANAASPILFPETVYNAPASHLAALLELDGQTYTLVGDSSVGLSGLHLATQLFATDQELERCIVVGTEEADWVLADAYGAWRLIARSGDLEVFGKQRGTVLGEGAAAVVLGRTHGFPLLKTGPGLPFFSRREAPVVARQVIEPILTTEAPDCVFCSANGTFVDRVEEQFFRDVLSTTPVYSHKPALGESLGASALFQVVLATLALRNQIVPGTLCGGNRLPTLSRASRSMRIRRVLVTTVGFNHQVNVGLIETTIESDHG